MANTVKAVDIGGDCYFIADNQPTMKLGCKSHAVFQKTFPESVYNVPTQEIERLFATYLSFADPHLDGVDAEDKPVLIGILEKRAALLQESNEYNASRLDSIQLDRYVVGIQEILQKLRGKKAKESKNTACKSGLKARTDEEIFMIVMEMAWKLAHPEAVSKDKACEWHALIDGMDKLELGKMVETIRAERPATAKPLNVLRTPPVKRMREAEKMENAMEVEADIRPQFEALLQLLAAKKYLGKSTIEAFNSEAMGELEKGLVQSVRAPVEEKEAQTNSVKTEESGDQTGTSTATTGSQTTKEHTGNYASSHMTMLPKRRPMVRTVNTASGNNQVSVEGAKPADAVKPAEEVKPVEPAEPVDEEVKPAEPAAENLKPAEPAAENLKPAEPAAENLKPAEPSEPAAENLKPAEPAAENLKPAEPSEPSEEANEEPHNEITAQAYEAAQKDYMDAEKEYTKAIETKAKRKTNQSKQKHEEFAVAAKARMDAAKKIINRFAAQKGGSNTLDLSTSDLYPLMTPIFDYLREMYDPVYSILEGFGGSISVSQLVPLLHLCHQLKTYRAGNASVSPYGVYRVAGLDQEVVEFISTQLGATKEHLSHIQATNGAVEAWMADVMALPQVRLSTVREPLAKSNDRPFIHMARMGVNFKLETQTPEVKRFFNPDDLYLICANSMPSIMMKETDTATTQIPMTLMEVDAQRIGRITPPVKTIYREKDAYVELTFERGAIFNDAELYLRIMSLIDKMYAGVTA